MCHRWSNSEKHLVFTPVNELFTNLMNNVSHNLNLKTAVGVRNSQEMEDIMKNSISWFERVRIIAVAGIEFYHSDVRYPTT